MIYIFDLDHTLINSEKLKDRLASILHFSRQEFDASRRQYFKSKQDLYSPLQHVDRLWQNKEINEKEKKKYLAKMKLLISEIDSLLDPAAEQILRVLRKQKNYLILLTRGDLVWQKMKVSNLKIKKYFHKVIITDQDKASALRWLRGRKEKVIIINDNARENLLLRQAWPQAKIIFIHGVHNNNVAHQEKVHKLKDIFKMYENKKEKN